MPMKPPPAENASPVAGASPGEKAYCAHNRSSGGLDFNGDACLPWREIPALIRRHWEFTAEVMRCHLHKGLPYEDSIVKAESWVTEGLKL
jgi:hypothetical protein